MAKTKLKDNPFPGFQKLMIRNVPDGSILNADNADNYGLKDSGSYLSDKHDLIIQPEDDDNWRLIPGTNQGFIKFHSLWDQVKGDKGFINRKVKEWYAAG